MHKLDTVLIDADILTYRIGFASQDVPEGIVKARVDTTVELIQASTETEKYRCFLTSTDHSNYRYTLYPGYKANRKQPKPNHYDLIRQHLQDKHKAEIVYNMEADDALGINQQKDTVIASIDKDLNQIPGWHYNFVNDNLYQVTPLGGLRFFYKQLLTGDKTDNISGIPRIGTKTADHLLQECRSEEEMFRVVVNQYKRAFRDNWYKYLINNGQLLKIKQKEDEPLWEPDERIKANTDPDWKTALDSY